MPLKESRSQTICSAVLTAGKHSKQSFTGSLTNFSQKSESFLRRSASCTRHSETCNEFKSLIKGSSRTILNKKSNLTIARNKSFENALKSTENCIHPCCSSFCATLYHVPRNHLYELGNKLQYLSMELNKEKNSNYVLKRRFLIAKKVLQNELGYNVTDFDSLLRKATNDNWRGKQELVFALKRKLRNLGEIVEHMETQSKEAQPKSIHRYIADNAPKIFSSESKEFHDMELERQEIIKNVERYKEDITSNRNSLKNALHIQKKRNKELIDEIIILRVKLSTVPESTVQRLIDRLHEIKSKIRINLEEKVEEKGKLEDIEQLICQNCRTITELKDQINLERKIGNDKEVLLKSLKPNNSNLCFLSEDLSKEKCKQAIVRKKLEDMQKKYCKLLIQMERSFAPTGENTLLWRKAKFLLERNKNTNIKELKKSGVLSNVQIKSKINNDYLPEKAYIYKQSKNIITDFNKLSSIHRISSYENKLINFQKKFNMLEQKKLGRLNDLHNISTKMEDNVTMLLKNRYIIAKICWEINVLKNQENKFRKAVNHGGKMKLVKKKNSFHQLTEIVDEVRIHLNILKTESKFLKTLIKEIFCSNVNEQKMLERFLQINKDIMLKHTNFKTLSLI